MKLLIIFIFTLLSTLLSANELHSFAHTSQDGNLLVSFELDETVKISDFALENPFRIVLEMQDVVKDEKIKELEEFKNSALKQIIVVPYKRNGVSNLKILIHLEKKSDYEVDVFGNRVLLNIKNIGDSEQLVAKKADSEKNLKTTNSLLEKEDNKNSVDTTKIASKQENKIDTTKKIEPPKVVEPENRLSKIEYQYQGNDLLIALQSNEERDIKSFHLMNPFRVVVDIPDTLKESSILNEIAYNDIFLEKAALSTYKRNGKTGTKVIFTFKDEKPFQAESIGATYVITIKNARETLVAKNQNFSEKQNPSKKIEKSETTIANNSNSKIENKSSDIEKNTLSERDGENKESKTTQTNNTIEQNKTVATKLEKIDYQYQGEDLLIALQADEDKEIKHFYLVDPFRVVIEFQNTTKDNSIPNEIKYEDNYLEKLVTSSFRKNGLTGIKLIFYFKEAKPFQIEQMGTTTLLTLKGVKTETIVAKNDNTQNNKLLENNNKNIPKEIKGNSLSKIDYQYQDEDLLIALQMNEERDAKHFHLIDPFRLVVDIPDTQKDDSILNEIKYNDSYFEKTMLSTYRRNGKNGVKLIFYFREERPFSVENIGNRAIITIKGAKPRVFIAQQKESIKNDNNTKTEPEKKLTKNSKNDKNNQKIAKTDEKVEQYSNDLESIQFDHSGDDLILMLQIKDQTKFKHFHLTDPFRVFVELEGVVVGKNFFKNITDEFIEDVSLTPFKKNGMNGLKVMFHFKENKPYEIDTIGNRVLLTIKNIPKKELLVSKNSNLIENLEKNSSKNISKNSVKLGNILESIKYEYTKDTIIFAIKCSEECKGDSFHLTSPFRVFVNIPNISISSAIPEEIAYNDPFIEKVTVTPYNRNGVKGSRVVFHFKQEKSYLVESIGTNTLVSLFGISGEAIAVKKDIEVFDVNDSDQNQNSTQMAINNSKQTENKTVSLNNALEKEDKSESTEIKNEKNISPKYVSVSTQEQKNQLASRDLHSNSQKKYYTISTSTYRNNNSTISIARNENSVFSSEKISRNLGEAPKLENIESKDSVSKSAIYLKSGFRKYEDSSRVTISTQNNPKIETHLDKKLLKITLKNTSFSPKASRFPLNTSYFDSNVLRVVSIQNGDDLVVQIYLKDSLEPEIIQGDGMIYVDFKE
ncbi:AMIN domain-containing protein [bacterium]|nr:AMIN domain-containing protein [bacterium]